MASEMSSREEILRRIRSAKGGASTAAAAFAGWGVVPREYKRAGNRVREVVLELLEDRLRDYDAAVARCERGGVAQKIEAMLIHRGKRRIVIPPGIQPEWLPSGFEFLRDDALPAATLDTVDGVLTGSTVAIAETGTVVLQNVTGQGRRAVSLVPDYHLCVVRVEDVVETVPEAMARLRGTAGLATTFVSGPSATADIEMTRIKGVHGPRFLDVILAM